MGRINFFRDKNYSIVNKALEKMGVTWVWEDVSLNPAMQISKKDFGRFIKETGLLCAALSNLLIVTACENYIEGKTEKTAVAHQSVLEMWREHEKIIEDNKRAFEKWHKEHPLIPEELEKLPLSGRVYFSLQK